MFFFIRDEYKNYKKKRYVVEEKPGIDLDPERNTRAVSYIYVMLIKVAIGGLDVSKK